MEGLEVEIKKAFNDIEKKIAKHDDLAGKDLLTLLVKALLDEEERK